jgi:peptidoglycan/LPS O-acetylase OafA/YrhL
VNRATSIFLDALRVWAALLVFTYHCVLIFYHDAVWIPGHQAVVIFFVLSGYVITFSTLSRGNLTAKKYAIARLSRLYSVVIPALLVTALTAYGGQHLNPGAYAQIIRPYDGIRFLASGLFVQSIWGLNLTPPGNGAFWSLGYEFWYYVMFGLAIFVRGWKWKIGSIVACALFVGINVLLLLPVWLLGVALYKFRDTFSLPRHAAALVFVVALAATISFAVMVPDYPAIAGAPLFFYASAFLTDWTFGIGVALVIWSFDQAWGTAVIAGFWERGIRWTANHTFSLYLFHMPLIVFVNTLGFFHPYVWWNAGLGIASILAVIVALSELTESRRKSVQKFIASLWDRNARFKRNESLPASDPRQEA